MKKEWMDIIERYNEDWKKISIAPTLSEDFIREFADKVDWACILECQELSEDFIREFACEIINQPVVKVLDDTCVVCGVYVGEGSHVCSHCRRKAYAYEE